ncbi:3-oxoacyl-[acyl-carrier-protein] synthase-3 [Isoptericola sp. CG 20/1183]|uniref:3-oxoacyl-[acyl-carrier-protein] synthase-3 n=1 Tax=Isoptericola halotolerans TaxID=300560 RepID=A0ABX5EIS9_9MICO|nr:MULTISPECIES: 3-oxoacyl-[acyl-carrier-protein] synthase III C-terminal domain-containing protein [Isoptericola]PRZ09590.1 3-oxoacyl-[acyl-carrier-protein] synthase-3 [Isoptericola sp. CG 20/1183]PRZ10391.1 3-oxoacyl-[acyl-carrier-protein] synthase-3 [Isoptericola halotolerans]
MLTLPAGAAGSRIVGLGHHQPAQVMTNDDIAQRVETNDEWIRSRTGIVTRHVAADDVTVADMATAAAEHALADAGVASDDVDLIVVATATAADRSPNTAGRVAYALRTGVQPGASTPEGEEEPDLRDVVGPGVVDVNTACSGFAYAVGLADQAIRAGTSRTAVVIGSEKLTAVTDWTDRSTCILTADGAGAVVLQAADEPAVGPVVWGSEPEITPAVRIEAPDGRFAQDGRAVFKWAITRAADRARRVVEASGLGLDDIEVLVAHQANLRIIEPLAKSLGLEDRVVVTDITESGNTSAASIPLGMSKWWHAGRLPAGAPALLFGFGGGFTWAGQVVLTPAAR